MEQRITRQTVKALLQGSVQYVDHNKEIRIKNAQSKVNTGDQMASNTSFEKSVGSASAQRKRKYDQRIIEPKAKVAKVSVSSTITTDKKNKHNSEAFAKRRTGETWSSPPNVSTTQLKQRKEIVEQSPCIRPFVSLKPDLDRVTNICCVDQTTFWIGDMSFGSIMKVKYNSFKTFTIVKVFTHSQCNFYDFCYDRKKDHILYTDRSNSSIMSISSKYEMQRLKSVKPLYPTCITVTPDDFIFVGLVDEYSYEESRSREIVKMAKNGTVVMRIQSIQDNLVRFTMPHKIAIHPNNDIVVAASDKTGGVMLSFDTEGQQKFKNTVTCPGVPFIPFGFTISKGGNIICFNEANGEFYILNSKGQLMKTVQSNLIGISARPWSLAFDPCGHLLIGTANTPLIYFAEYFDG